jgi:O-antigen/teichoic acid export membrane protein
LNKRFVANVAGLVIVNLLIKPFWIFGIDRTVQNTVGATAYGAYFALFNFSFLLQALLDFGINNYNSRAVAQEPQWLDKHFAGILTVKLLLTGLYLLLCLGGAYLLGYGVFEMWILVVLCVNQALLSFIGYFRSNLQGLHRFRSDGFMSVLDRVFMIAICATILWGGFLPAPFKIEWFVYAQTAGYLLTAFVGVGLIAGHLHRPEFNIDRSFLVGILRKSYPFALIGVLMSIYHRIDSVMLEKMLPSDGAHEAGIYASAYRLLDAVNMVGVLLSTILLPMFARMLIKGESVTSLVSFTAKGLYAFATAGAVSCFFFSEPIMFWLYVDATPYYASVFGWLMLSFIAISSVYVFGALLTANHNLWQINTIALVSVVLNVGLNYVLIPPYKALGSSWVALFTQCVAALAFIVVATKKLSFQINYGTLFRVALYLPVCIGIAILGARSNLFVWQASFLLSFIVCLFVAWVAGLLAFEKSVAG